MVFHPRKLPVEKLPLNIACTWFAERHPVGLLLVKVVVELTTVVMPLIVVVTVVVGVILGLSRLLLSMKLMKDFRFGKQEIRNSGEILARMHGIDIVHGDFTPANIMVDAGEVHVIDFGLSEFSKDAEEKALDILLMKRSITPEMYKEFREGYAKVSKDSKAILNRLAKIESRGRYQTRTLM